MAAFRRRNPRSWRGAGGLFDEPYGPLSPPLSFRFERAEITEAALPMPRPDCSSRGREGEWFARKVSVCVWSSARSTIC